MHASSFCLVSSFYRPAALCLVGLPLALTLLHCGGDDDKKPGSFVGSGGSAGTAAQPAGGAAGSGPVPFAQTGAVLATACPATACGGDLKGTWDLALDCVSPGTSAELRAAQQSLATRVSACPTAVAEVRFTVTGTATFEAAGTYRIQTSPLGASTLIRLPKSCLNDAAKTCQNMTGFVDKGDACEMTDPQTQDAQNEAGTYAVSGNNVQFTPAAPGTPDTWTGLCVQGDIARAVSTDADGVSYVFRLTRRSTP